jgi:uncharacterized membrane protein YtjA (UPF0391 family)
VPRDRRLTTEGSKAGKTIATLAKLRQAWGLPWLSATPFQPPLTEDRMFYWAAVFLVIALVAAFLGFSGIAGLSMNVAWILVVAGLVLAVVFFLKGRRHPTP